MIEAMPESPKPSTISRRLQAAVVPRLEGLVPMVVRPGLEQLARDLSTVAQNLRGDPRIPWRKRDPARWRVGTVGVRGREYELVAKPRETADAVSLILRDLGPEGDEAPRVRPGQFFTLSLTLDGQVLRRAYSASGDCRERGQLRLTIKRVVGGRVSNYVVDHLEVGARLHLLGPSGGFGLEPAPAADRGQLVMLAGGSGITPMMAMITTLLAVEADTRITLVFANRGPRDVIFTEELERLAATYAGLRVRHVLERPPPGWEGGVGRLDADTLARELAGLGIAGEAGEEFFVCGPAGMMQAARDHLRGVLGITDARIHEESFLQPHAATDASKTAQIPHAVTIAVDDRELGIIVQPGQSILEAGLSAGLPMPYSCAMGGCAACKVHVEIGDVVMREPNCLSQAERERGNVLACVASPLGPCRVRVLKEEG